MVAGRRQRWARRAGATRAPDAAVAVGEPGPEQAWRSAPPVRRCLSEPMSPVIPPAFTDRLATWRLTMMTAITRPPSTWTCLTPLTQSAWITRRGARTAPQVAQARPEQNPGPARWRSAAEPGGDLATVARLSTRPSRGAVEDGSGGPDPVAVPNRSIAAGIRRPAALIPGDVDGPVAGPPQRASPADAAARRASHEGTPGATRRDRPPLAGLGPALPGLPLTARPLRPRDEEQLPARSPESRLPVARRVESAAEAGPGRSPATDSAPLRAPGGSGPGGSGPGDPVPGHVAISSYGQSSVPADHLRPVDVAALAREIAQPLRPREEEQLRARSPELPLPVVHRFESAAGAGPVRSTPADSAPLHPLRAQGGSGPGSSGPGGPVPGGPVPGHVTISSYGQRFASADHHRAVDTAALAREIARRHGDEIAQAAAPVLARLLRPPRDRSAERDKSPPELPR